MNEEIQKVRDEIEEIEQEIYFARLIDEPWDVLMDLRANLSNRTEYLEELLYDEEEEKE